MTTDQAKTGKVDLGSGKAQHVDLWRKVKLRRELLEHAVLGAAYVPFIGEADIADQLYTDRRVFGVELDPDVAETARRRLGPDATVVTGNAEGPLVFNPEMRFAIADVDAFSNPYPALELFWRQAVKADRVVVFGTDGMRLAIRQSKTRIYGELPAGKILQADLAAKRRQWNGWWTTFVRPYLDELVAPGRIVVEQKYLRAHMCYWGIVVDTKAAIDSAVAIPEAFAAGVTDSLKASDRARGDASRPTSDDASLLETADGSARKPSSGSRQPRSSREPGDDGSPDDIAKVEAALLEAAASGNVPAAIFWLEHKGGKTWAKADPSELARRLAGKTGRDR